MASGDNTHLTFDMDGDSNYDMMSDYNAVPAPALKVMPGGRLQFENFSILSDSASEAGSLFLSKKECEKYSLKKSSCKNSSAFSHFSEDKNPDNILITKNETVWDYLKMQEEKLKILENQVSSFLKQEKTSNPVAVKSTHETVIQKSKNNSKEDQLHDLDDLESNNHSQGLTQPLLNPTAEKTADKTESERQDSNQRQLCERNDSKVHDHYLNLIFLYLKEQNDQIRQLKDQVDLVVKRTGELESFQSMMKERHFNLPGRPMYTKKSDWEDAYNGAQNVVLNAGIKNVNDNNIYCQEQTEVKTSSISTMTSFVENLKSNDKEQTHVKKNSSSTMTSLIIGDSDKLVVRKTLTVVTDISNHQKDVQHSKNKSSSPSAHNAKELKEKCSPSLGVLTSKKDNENTTPKLIGSKKHKQKKSRKPKEPSNRPRENDCEFSYQSNFSSKNSDSTCGLSSPFNQLKRREKETSSPKFDSDLENHPDNKSPNTSRLHINNQEKKTTPHSHPQISRGKYTPQIYSFPDGSSMYGRCTPHNYSSSKQNRELCSRSSSSRSSGNESPDGSPEREKYDEFRAMKDAYDLSSISQYGLHTTYLSEDTKKYLERNNLVIVKNTSTQKR